MFALNPKVPDGQLKISDTLHYLTRVEIFCHKFKFFKYMHDEFDKIIIAGGFVTFIAGKTNKFTDINFYIFEQSNNLRNIILKSKKWLAANNTSNAFNHYNCPYQIIFIHMPYNNDNIKCLLNSFDLDIVKCALDFDGKYYELIPNGLNKICCSIRLGQIKPLINEYNNRIIGQELANIHPIEYLCSKCKRDNFRLKNNNDYSKLYLKYVKNLIITNHDDIISSFSYYITDLMGKINAPDQQQVYYFAGNY
ncbi:hypothetical protein SGHV025 [Glossina pallidipes salivary gland hypertrophy virus]|uniref:Uncharacterized protein n=1 Tax=Glossina hytrovirus (isolate Glossina pallidipes/Ethiopia/Seibersdorf/-) TaxID=379529 RepID=B0YLH9_GHVS|nr:hypothetical protein SGHV025 [Glossina pallidipes salivary gland hypertrophy virus]ABQ08798.1 hypothetical protein SGHV025 [Glossina pallidipes salivary gland hypertrophy virus]